MKLSNNWKLKKLGDEAILMPIGQNAYDLRSVINLNTTSVELFELLQQGKEEKDLVNYLTSNYEVSEEEASNDVHEFILKLKGSKIILDD